MKPVYITGVVSAKVVWVFIISFTNHTLEAERLMVANEKPVCLSYYITEPDRTILWAFYGQSAEHFQSHLNSCLHSFTVN